MKLLRSLALLPATSLFLACPTQTPEPPAPTPPKTPPASQPASKPAPAAKTPANAKVFFRNLQDGSTVFENVAIAFGLEGMKVRPAGQDPNDMTTGHHHVLIDVKGHPKGTPVPADANNIHFGKGQTEAIVKVPTGDHTLTLQLADGVHRSYGPQLATSLKVKVLPEPKERKVEWLSPKAGAKVKSPVKVKMGLVGMKVRPAGEDPLDKTSGHHHIIVDGSHIPVGAAVPADGTHIHYGKGQTETELKLEPGKHKLTLQLADGLHLSYGQPMSATIEIEVTK